MSDPLAVEQLRVWKARAAERDAKFTTTWQTLSQYGLPSESDINVEKTEDVVGWTDKIFDTTMIQANLTMAAGQRNWLTPSTEPWAEFQPPEEMRSDGDDAAQWLAKASDIAMTEIQRSNFYAIVNVAYQGVGIFGTDLIFCEEGKKTSLNFRHAKIGTYTIAEDDEGVVDSVHREFEMTGRQIRQFFKEEEIPEKLDRLLAKELDKKVKLLHAIFPRKDSQRLDKRSDGANKPIASVYIWIDGSEIMRESGYDEMPAICQRFQKWGTGSVWGYSPAYLALPEARQLNYVVQYTDALAELHAYPRIIKPSNLVGDVDLRAGGVTVVDPLAGDAVPREWATVGDLRASDELKEEKRTKINEMFYVDIFKRLGTAPMLDKKMTAFEISRREAEDLSQFTPAFDRRIPEFLNPLMKRVFGILFRAGKFGKPPASLLQPTGNGKAALVQPEIIITSRIAMALKALQNRGIETTFAFLAPMGEQHPEIYDNFDIDKVVRDYSRNSGVSPDLMRNTRQMDGIRQNRQQQIQKQQAMQNAQALGKAGAGLGKSPEWLQDGVKSAVTGEAA